MKLEIEGTPTVSTGVTESWSCGIAENEVAFDAWSSKIYTRKERAIVRELSCNAFDAHVAAGTPEKPFEIHLPTQHEPYFSINDFGTGLSHEDMKLLFSLYFGSNKRKSNKFIGALGLGSKSPYCYKGNGGIYTVISRKDGVTRMYVASKINGMPHMEQSGPAMETPDAPNGIEIKFGVAEKDIWTWENEAKVALEFFPHITTNVAGFQPKRYQYSLKTDNWGLRTEAHTSFGYQARAIMGKVQYSIGDLDRSLIKNDTQKAVLDMPIDMFFPLGALDFSLSRESLEITDKTLAAILTMCDSIYSEFIDTVRAKIESCPTLWDAQLLVWDLINNTATGGTGSRSMGALISQALNSGKLYGNYTNFTFDERSAKVDTMAYDHVGVNVFTFNPNATKRAKKSLLFMYDAGAAAHARKSVTADSAEGRYVEVTVEPKTMFVINDTNLPGDKYIHYFLHQSGKPHGKKVVYVIHRNHKEADLKKVIKEGKKLITSIGGPQVTLMSELVAMFPQLAVVRGSGSTSKRGGYGRREVLVFKAGALGSRRRYTNTGWTKAWRAMTDEEIVDYTGAKKFYVAIDKLVATDTKFSDAFAMNDFITNLKASGKFGITGDTLIFGVKRHSKALKNNKGEFVELMSHVYSRVATYMTPTKTLALSLHINPFSDDCDELLDHLASKQPLSNSPIQQFALSLSEAKGVRESNWGATKAVLDFCAGRGKYTQGLTVDFNEKWQSVKALYPMLKHIGRYEMRREMKETLDYIKMVDERDQVEAFINKQAAAVAATASN